MNLRALLTLSAGLLAGSGSAQTPSGDRAMRVGLFRERPTSQIVVMGSKSACAIYVDGVRAGEIKTSDGLRIEVEQGRITARSLSLSFTGKKHIQVVPVRADGGFRLRALDRKEAEREYPGWLEARVAGDKLLLVDAAPLEAYTAGVVKSEAGNGHHPEYYKLQAVSCRTYALTNQRRHLLDGFEVCDGVHCQVFHGRSRNDSIVMAVESTRGLVIVDSGIRLIHATFHSNCGGETMNAEDLWSKHEPYLRATVDTFCLGAPHARWQKTISRRDWLAYLDRQFGFRSTDSTQLLAVLAYEPKCRDLYLGNTRPLIPLKQVREDLKLKSTFFSVGTSGDQMLLGGRGFGHAVGLCQEGAMAMARAGFGYGDILHHYFAEVHLVDITTIDFFRDEWDALIVPARPSGR